jgi:cytochrome c551/c552
MKKILTALFLFPLVLALLLIVAVGIAVQQDLVSRSDLEFLVDLGKRDGPAAALAVIRTEIYGTDLEAAADPGYGRVQIEGRGHAPWVIRSNLDGHPRMLLFALRPDIWAAYDTQQQALYQVWDGDVLFQGSVYDYRHGPQPVSQGDWYLQDSEGVQWYLEANGEELPATIQYLGHEYGEGRKTALMRFALTAGDYRLELTEQPEVIERTGQRYLTRTFQRSDTSAAVEAGFRTHSGERYRAQGTLEFPLATTTPIEIATQDSPSRGRDATENEVLQGESVIANSDCLSCHARDHKVTGPAWAQIAGKFRGKIQPEVHAALTKHVLEGTVGIWGPVPMPAHPQLTTDEAAAAVAYILSIQEQTTNINTPKDKNGRPYAATLEYDVLPRLTSLHPSFRLENLAPTGFEPKVGGMTFRKDGKLVIVSWDQDGAVFLMDPNAPAEQRVRRIAEGLHEPLGVTMVGDRLFVLQKQELTELIDTDGDEVIDRYRTVNYDWPSSTNFHAFAFGLLHQDDDFYFLLAICILPGGASCPEQLPTQGKLLRLRSNGELETYASGFRVPNGIAVGPEGDMYVTDNQGDWLPSSKLIHIEQDGFYGSRAVPDEGVMTRKEIPPVVWLPQDEVGNSPSQPLLLTEGPYAGQMIHGDVYNGGVKRVFLEDVAGQQQGAVFQFSAGFQGAVNRLERGPDGAIYLGELGNPPNWGEYGKPWYGLERMTWVDNEAFEMLAVKAQDDGFVIELTQPLAADVELTPTDILAKQWFYHPNEQYGGPKYDETTLYPSAVEVSEDHRSIHVVLPGMKAGYVVYLRLDDRLRADNGSSLWTAEAWYTLNAIPGGAPSVPLAGVSEDGWRDLFDGKTLSGWRNMGGDENNVRKWTVQDGNLTLVQDGVLPSWELIKSFVFGGPVGDLVYYRQKFRNFELSLQWKIAPGGNSGIFYLIKDETESGSSRTGIEMQVLDNKGHPDGQITTHRSGDLYDMIASSPETVNPPGAWNDVLIRVKDNQIEHWLNGVKVVSILRGSAEWDALVAASKFADMPEYGKPEAGYIALQDHGDPVWFRNIRVRELQ